MADSKISALSELSVPDMADIGYEVDDTGPTSYKLTAARRLGRDRRGACEGRLTLTTATPITTADVIGATTLYWSPIDAGLITLFDGTRWVGFFQAELSLALSGLTSGKNYDAFLSYNAGTPALVLGTAWTNDTTRAVGLTTQNGILVLSGTTTSRYVGTIRTTSTTTTEDSGGTAATTQVGGKRFVWNYYNRARRDLKVIDTTDTWGYTTTTTRQAGAVAGNKVEYVSGVADVPVEARVAATIYGINATGAVDAVVGVGVDSTTVISGIRGGYYNPSGAGPHTTVVGSYAGSPGLGYHYLAWLESGSAGTCNFYGDNGGAKNQSGLIATIVG